ncbi:MAG: GMC family oxidoreductase N-terminal domain-containing protein, partial [Bacteriovoracaceae bacterium]
YNRNTYPTKEIDSNSRLYWSGGIEFNLDSSIGFLRPKCVGGGSIVNQALIDRFDEDALSSWKEKSGVSFFNTNDMKSSYEAAESELHLQEIPAKYHNGNAKIFQDGFAKNGYKCSPLIRAQKDCKFEEGNSCIECLSGCRIDSKQSMPVALLPKADTKFLAIESEFEVCKIEVNPNLVKIIGKNKFGATVNHFAKKLVLASGAIGNSKLLLQSGMKIKMPSLGENFYTHPQYMLLGLYDFPVNSHLGPLQSFKSSDPNFRAKGFKLENVFAPPVAISMLIPGFEKKHQRLMKQITHLACIEVCVRDTHAGKIGVAKNGKVLITKTLNEEDQKRRRLGIEAIHNIFSKTNAKEIIEGVLPIGLHLMGGLGIGVSGEKTVVSPDFSTHVFKNVFVSDSSIFPNAPGINPSLTIMALSKMSTPKIINSFKV